MTKDLINQITDYLSSGGLFNPELADHNKVRDLLIECRKALETLKIIKDRDMTYQKQVVTTMYNRAKYHPYQTPEMKDAMKIFDEWLKKHN